MTLTSAPELTTLGELGCEWRNVAFNPGFGKIVIWHGDLADRKVRARYLQMVKDNLVVVVTYRTPTGGQIFAKLARHPSTVVRVEPPPPAPDPEPEQTEIVPVAKAGRGFRGVFAVHPSLRPRKPGPKRVDHAGDEA